MSDELKREALAYHAAEPAGKLADPADQADGDPARPLASPTRPGVAVPCLEIAGRPRDAARYTGRAATSSR